MARTTRSRDNSGLASSTNSTATAPSASKRTTRNSTAKQSQPPTRTTKKTTAQPAASTRATRSAECEIPKVAPSRARSTSGGRPKPAATHTKNKKGNKGEFPALTSANIRNITRARGEVESENNDGPEDSFAPTHFKFTAPGNLSTVQFKPLSPKSAASFLFPESPMSPIVSDQM